MVVVGVDASKKGWIAIVLGDGKDADAHHLPTIEALQPLATDADAIAIDIPIGLPTGGPREADVLAREFLGARRNSVFLTPVREAIEAQTHALATQAAFARTGTGISQQAYALGTKILEVERWLPSSPCPVYEVHPEVSFAILLGAPARASKKTWGRDGRAPGCPRSRGNLVGSYRQRRGGSSVGGRHVGCSRSCVVGCQDCPWDSSDFPRST